MTSPAVRSAALAIITAGVLVASAAIIATPLSVNAYAASASRATAPADAPDTASDSTQRLYTAGEPVMSGEWEVTIGDPLWGQTQAVWDATAYPDYVLPGYAHEWVLAPVTVTNLGDEDGILSGLDIKLRSSSHTEHYSYPERQTIPDELQQVGIGIGETRTGNVAWLLASERRDAGCMYTVAFEGSGDYTFACETCPGDETLPGDEIVDTGEAAAT